jgi:hypothetical protein
MIQRNSRHLIFVIAIAILSICVVRFSMESPAINSENRGCANLLDVRIFYDNPVERLLLYFGRLRIISEDATYARVVAQTFLRIPFSAVEINCEKGSIRRMW